MMKNEQSIADRWRNADTTAERVGVVVGAVGGALFGLLIFFALPLYVILTIVPWPIVLGSVVILGWTFITQPWLFPPPAPPKPVGLNMSNRAWKGHWNNEFERICRQEFRRRGGRG